MYIWYKYKYWKVLIFIAEQGTVSTVPSGPYLFRYPDKFSNVCIFLVVNPRMVVSLFSSFKVIYQQKKIEMGTTEGVFNINTDNEIIIVKL